MGFFARLSKKQQQPVGTVNTKEVVVNSQGIHQEFNSDEEGRKVVGVLNIQGIDSLHIPFFFPFFPFFSFLLFSSNQF